MFRPLLTGLLVLSLLPAAAMAGDNGFWQTLTIAGAGKIHPLPQAAYQPDRAATYKAVFLLTMPSAKPGEINPALEHVARAVNLYVQSGVPLDHLKFVAVAVGPATPLALDNAQYRKQFGVDNPNLRVIAQLRKDGIDVAVCGQAWAEHKFDYSWKDASVTLALSGLTTVINLQQQGYALMQL
jgi:intracellular sulfur oxidation DsrE/DsrF family protein